MERGKNGLTPIKVGRFWGTPEAAAPSEAVVDYLANLVQHPDPKSAFAKNRMVQAISSLLKPKRVVTFLLWQNYGGMVFMRGSTIVGHVIGQKHDDQFHVFAIKVIADDERNRQVATSMVRTVVIELHKFKLFSWIRIGAGGDSYVARIHQRILDEGLNNNFGVLLGKGMPKNADSSDGWVYVHLSS